jgi:hypothetical protein
MRLRKKFIELRSAQQWQGFRGKIWWIKKKALPLQKIWYRYFTTPQKRKAGKPN